MKPATDKQIAYLHKLQAKAHRIQKRAESRGATVYRKPLANYDYNEERRRGMTSTDASIRIGAWRDLVLFGNMTLALFNIPQVQ